MTADIKTSRGFIYFAVNPTMPGLVKIGETRKAVGKRLHSLRTTGVPAHFEVFAMISVSETKACENAIHNALAAHRFEEDREFFRLNPATALAKSWKILERYLAVTHCPSDEAEDTFSDLDSTEEILLIKFGLAPSFQRPNSWEWATRLVGLAEIDARHYLHSLANKQYLKGTNNRYGGCSYDLAPRGLEFVRSVGGVSNTLHDRRNYLGSNLD